MFGRLRIRATVVEEAVACPVDAVVENGPHSYVMTLDRPGIYLRQPVKLGLRSGGYVEVLDGLFPGDPVVTTGKHELASLFAAEAEHVPPVSPAQRQPAAAAGDRGVPTDEKHVIAQAQIELPTDKKAKAFSTATGRIARVLVEHGEPVHAGQVLAEVESLELRDVQLDLLLARARLKLSRELLDRYTRLGENGGVAQKDLWQAQTDVDTLGATVASLQNKLSLLGLSEAEIQRVSQLDVTDSAATDGIRTTTEVRRADRRPDHGLRFVDRPGRPSAGRTF